jgi:hypothetical protein
MTTALLDERMYRTCRMANVPDVPTYGIRLRGPMADPREERRAILGVPHLDRLAAPHDGVSSGLETPAGLLQQPGRGPSSLGVLN